MRRSCGIFPGELSENKRYRQFFAARWQKFIQANFESPEHAAATFRVNATTGINWWHGMNAPQGWVVGKAIADPDMSAEAMKYLSRDSKCGNFDGG